MSYWNSKEWKEKCEKYLTGKLCARCGSDKDILVHHTHETRYIRKIFLRVIVSRLLNVEFPSVLKTIIEFKCAKCGVVSNTTSRTKYSYRCPKCYSVNIFDKKALEKLPWAFIRYGSSIFDAVYFKKKDIKRVKHLTKQEYAEFVKSHEEKINDEMKKEGIPDEPGYKDIDKDTIPLCKICHFIVEKGVGIVKLPSGISIIGYGKISAVNNVILDLSSKDTENTKYKTKLKNLKKEIEEWFDQVDLEKVRVPFCKVEVDGESKMIIIA